MSGVCWQAPYHHSLAHKHISLLTEVELFFFFFPHWRTWIAIRLPIHNGAYFVDSLNKPFCAFLNEMGQMPSFFFFFRRPEAGPVLGLVPGERCRSGQAAVPENGGSVWSVPDAASYGRHLSCTPTPVAWSVCDWIRCHLHTCVFILKHSHAEWVIRF